MTGNEIVVYLYDANGAPIGMRYRNDTYAKDVWDIYWFNKNLQGDILGVYNSTGTQLVSYSYDPWGEVYIHYTSGGASTSAAKNSLMYRGYYYDKDLGLYYLISRYYDANIGRFISADGYVSTGQGLIGYNMYAYCGNNPIMMVDYGGEFPWLIIGILVVTTVVGGVLGYKSDVKIGDTSTTKNEVPESDKSIMDDNEGEKLSTKDRVRNTIIGAGLGLAVGGAIVATGGVFAGAVAGNVAVGYLGVTALQGMAIGSLALDFSAMALLPAFGIEIEPIEYETPATPAI